MPLRCEISRVLAFRRCVSLISCAPRWAVTNQSGLRHMRREIGSRGPCGESILAVFAKRHRARAWVGCEYSAALVVPLGRARACVFSPRPPVGSWSGAPKICEYANAHTHTRARFAGGGKAGLKRQGGRRAVVKRECTQDRQRGRNLCSPIFPLRSPPHPLFSVLKTTARPPPGCQTRTKRALSPRSTRPTTTRRSASCAMVGGTKGNHP